MTRRPGNKEKSAGHEFQALVVIFDEKNLRAGKIWPEGGEVVC
jgi:hypothetical protein